MNAPLKTDHHVHLFDGVAVCMHPRQRETVRWMRPGWRKARAGRRWTQRMLTRPQRIVTVTCPDCPSWAQLDVTRSDRWYLVLAPYFFAAKEN
jgi:hypothetical protein